jgi:hypothetical protein
MAAQQTDSAANGIIVRKQARVRDIKEGIQTARRCELDARRLLDSYVVRCVWTLPATLITDP